jgi:hypothetical protein
LNKKAVLRKEARLFALEVLGLSEISIKWFVMREVTLVMPTKAGIHLIK